MLGARRLSRLAIGYGGNPPIGFCDDDAREHFAQTTGASGNSVYYVTALPGSGKTHLLYRHAGSPTTFACHVIGGEVNRWSSGQYRAMIHGIRGKFGVLGNV